MSAPREGNAQDGSDRDESMLNDISGFTRWSVLWQTFAGGLLVGTGFFALADASWTVAVGEVCLS